MIYGIKPTSEIRITKFKLKLIIVRLLPSFLRNFVFSVYGYILNKKRKAYSDKYLKEMNSFEKLSENEKESNIEQKLINQLKDARNFVPFYKKYWDNVLSNNPNIDFTDLANWPILEKQSIKNNPHDFISDKFQVSKLIKISTSGSTGTPMSFYFDTESYSQWYTYYYYHLMIKDGISLDEPWGNIGGRLIVETNKKKPPFWIWNKGMKQLYLSSYHLTEVNGPYYLKAIEDYNLTYLVGYPSSIYSLAKSLLQNKLSCNCIKVIYTNAEPLFDYQRDAIQKVFKCKIRQTYGSSEFAISAAEEDNNSLSIWPLTGVLEVICNTNEETGEFCVTGLVNRAMPLVRYKIGDSGISDIKYSNGRIKSILKVIGRNDDLIKSKSGKLIGRLDPIFKLDLKIKEAQIIQESLEIINIIIVPEIDFSSLDESRLYESAKERLGDDFIIKITRTNSIPRGANNKFKAVISKV